MHSARNRPHIKTIRFAHSRSNSFSISSLWSFGKNRLCSYSKIYITNWYRVLNFVLVKCLDNDQVGTFVPRKWPIPRKCDIIVIYSRKWSHKYIWYSSFHCSPKSNNIELMLKCMFIIICMHKIINGSKVKPLKNNRNTRYSCYRWYRWLCMCLVDTINNSFKSLAEYSKNSIASSIIVQHT